MRRRTFDFLATSIGAVLTVVLLIAGGLLLWGANFANNSVHDQLAAQKITFPPAVAFAHPQAGTEITPSMIPSVSQYAGQQLTTGAQAQVYANDFIQVHLNNMAGGKTYAQVSSEAFTLPANSAKRAQLESTAQTLFQGTTLRGLLLEAYGFSVMGSIAWYGALASFFLAGIFFLLTMLGFLHFRKEDEKEELLGPKSVAVPQDKKEPALV